MRLLIVTHYVPMPDRQADMLRLVEMLRIAVRRHDVAMVVTDQRGQAALYGREPVDGYRAQIERLGVRIVDERKATGDEASWDVIVFEHYLLARNRIERMRYRFPRAIVMVDTVDIAYLRVASKTQGPGDRALSDEAKAVRREELAAYRSADVVVAISPAECERLREDLPRHRFHVVPLILDVPPLAGTSRPAHDAAGPRLLFVGNFTYAANADAIRHLVTDIFPRVRAALPDARLTIVGNAPPDDVVSDPTLGIEVTGFVPDLAPYYAEADVSVAPLRWGGGLKGKVAEAMAHGLPVVTSSVGASGFDLEPGVEALIADSPEAFANAVIELHRDPARRDAIRRRGWTLANARYSRTAVTDAVDGLFALAARVTPPRLPLRRRVSLATKIAFHRHVGWRFEQQHR